MFHTLGNVAEAMIHVKPEVLHTIRPEKLGTCNKQAIVEKTSDPGIRARTVFNGVHIVNTI